MDLGHLWSQIGHLWSQFIGWGGWDWHGWGAIGSIATALALVVALALGLGITRVLFKPFLTVSLTPGYPDFCPVATANGSEQYYCRFRVNNSAATRPIARARRWWRNARRVSATNVEVMLSKLWDVTSKPAKEIQPFLPVQLTWAYRVTSPLLRPETEVIVETIQPDVFRYCNLCRVDKAALNWLEFATFVIPNPMQGKWATRKPVGLYEVDLVLTAANFGPEFVTFRIDFKGGAWPADDNFDPMYTVRLVSQRNKPPKRP